MAPQAAKITSIDALRELRTALVRFCAEAEAALTALDLEARRPVDWIENDRTRYWPSELRKADDRLNEARQALARCEQNIAGDDTRYCYDERKTVERAKRRLRLCEDRVQAVRRWRPQIRKDYEEFQAQLAKFKTYLESDLTKAIAALEKMSTALDRYVETRTVNETPLALGESGLRSELGEGLPPAAQSSNNSRSG
jgi:DNA repair exonuclease SbcCD ATPase subunit